MRDLKTLYCILLREYKKSDTNYICTNIFNLYVSKKITFRERALLKKHFVSQYPSKNLHTEFFDNELFRKRQKKGVWFTLLFNEAKGRKIRIDFINKIISTL